MPRFTDAEVIAALKDRVIRVAHLFEGVFENTTLRIWSGVGPLTWDGKTWLGDGWILSPGQDRETTAADAVGMQITLSGVPATLLELALTETAKTGTGKRWFAILNAAGEVVGTDLRFSGDLDSVSYKRNASQSSIVVAYESKLRRMNISREVLYSDAYQQSVYPGDLGFAYVAYLASQRFYWGRQAPASS